MKPLLAIVAVPLIAVSQIAATYWSYGAFGGAGPFLLSFTVATPPYAVAVYLSLPARFQGRDRVILAALIGLTVAIVAEVYAASRSFTAFGE